MNKPMTPYYVEPEDLSTTDRTRREDFTQRGIVHKPVYLAADVDVELTALRQHLHEALGALGYPVPGDTPQGRYKCGLCEATQQLYDLPPHSVAYQQRIAALELQLAQMTDEVQHYRKACASVGETDGHGWAETTRELRRQIAAMIVDRDEARLMYENQCAGSKARHEHIQSLNQQLAVTKNVIAQLSEQLAESDRMKKALRSKLDDHNISDVSMGWV